MTGSAEERSSVAEEGSVGKPQKPVKCDINKYVNNITFLCQLHPLISVRKEKLIKGIVHNFSIFGQISYFE